MRFDLAGRVVLDVIGDDAVGDLFRRQLAPFRPIEDAAGPPALEVVPLAKAGSPSELQGPAEDGLLTGRLGPDGFVAWDGRRCTIPNVLEGQSTFGYEPGFPMWRLLRAAIRPALQIQPAVAGGAAAIHAASVTLDGGAIVVAGWAESGKTETALALMERGAAFLSDKWTYVGRKDLEASLFPISIGVRRWVLDHLPTLHAATTRRSRVQFAMAGAAGLLLRPIGRRPGRTRASAMVPGMARWATSTGDRAAYEVEELRAAYRQADDPLRRAPVRLLAMLKTTVDDEIRVRPMAPEELATRLSRTAAYERRSYLNLLHRFAYLDSASGGNVTETAMRADEDVLADICRGVEVVAIEAPFPTDPRRVADAILTRL